MLSSPGHRVSTLLFLKHVLLCKVIHIERADSQMGGRNTNASNSAKATHMEVKVAVLQHLDYMVLNSSRKESCLDQQHTNAGWGSQPAKSCDP